MKSETIRTIQDRATRNAPKQARAYYLVGTPGRFPAEGAWQLEPFQPPDLAVPTGSYRFGFMNAVTNGQEIDQSLGGGPAPTIQIYEEQKAGSQAMSKPAKEPENAKAEDPLLRDPRHLEDRLDYRRGRMTAKIVEKEQLLSKRLLRNREQAEGFVLNRAYRQELTGMAADQQVLGRNYMAMVNTSIESAKELASANAMLVASAKDMATKVKEALAEAAPPAPPESHIPMMITAGVDILVAALGGRRRKGRGETPIDAILGGRDDGDDITEKIKREKSKKALLTARAEEAEKANKARGAKKGTKATKATKAKRQSKPVLKKAKTKQPKPVVRKGPKRAIKNKAAAKKTDKKTVAKKPARPKDKASPKAKKKKSALLLTDGGKRRGK